MYCFLKRQPIQQATGSFKPDWTGDKDFDYKQLHLKHLIKVVLGSSGLSIEDIFTHPFFMDLEQFSDFENVLESYCFEHNEMDQHMEESKSVIFTDDWTLGFDQEIVQKCASLKTLPTSYANSFKGLWQARLNSRSYKADMFMVETDYFEFWQNRFPAFFIHLFMRLITYKPPDNNQMLYALNQFRHFFPADPAGGFYEVCASQTIFD